MHFTKEKNIVNGLNYTLEINPKNKFSNIVLVQKSILEHVYPDINHIISKSVLVKINFL